MSVAFSVLKIAVFLIIGTFLRADDPYKLFQVAPFSALEKGGFEGALSIEKLSKEGNFGIGTFSGLDGQMVAYKGKYYYINLKGQVKKANERRKVPFAQVVHFNPEISFKLEHLRNLDILSEAISDQMEFKNHPYALMIKGKFTYLKLSSYKEQKRPYSSLKKAKDEQGVYYYEEVEGALIGFWFPSYFSNVAESGYHFHFLSDHFDQGGLVVDMHLESGEVSLMPIETFEVFLPKTATFNQLNIN